MNNVIHDQEGLKNSLERDVERIIHIAEGFYAALVIYDFHDALHAAEDALEQIHICLRWKRFYREVEHDSR